MHSVYNATESNVVNESSDVILAAYINIIPSEAWFLLGVPSNVYGFV